MARFTVRIELHTEHQTYDHPNHPVYSLLNHAMEVRGFSRTIETGGLKQLPRAEYTITGDFSCTQVLRVAKKVCETTDRDYAIVVCKTLECMTIGLKPITQTLKISRRASSTNQNAAMQAEIISFTDSDKEIRSSLKKERNISELPANLETITANLQKTRAYLNGIADVVKKNRAVLAKTRAIMESTRIDNPINYTKSE